MVDRHYDRGYRANMREYYDGYFNSQNRLVDKQREFQSEFYRIGVKMEQINNPPMSSTKKDFEL